MEYYTLCHENLQELIHYVIMQNDPHHDEVLSTKNIATVMKDLCVEEEQYLNSHIFVAARQKKFVEASEYLKNNLTKFADGVHIQY